MYHYENIKPKINTYCFFKLSPRRIRPDDLGVEVLLIDYNNLEAFIPITEINRKKFNITTFFKSDTIYPGIVYSTEDEHIMISYSKIKQEKREKLLKAFEVQSKISKIITEIRTKFPSIDILNPIIIDFTDQNYDDIEKIYQNILLNPEQISLNELVINYIIEHRNIIKPVYEQHFMLTIIESNGLQILKEILTEILTEINKEYKVKIISSPLYCIEFNDLTQIDKIKETLEHSIKNNELLFELKDLITVKELHVDF
jgi:translation initiation factor 2 alpha subunit (eIF-2alpha)